MNILQLKKYFRTYIETSRSWCEPAQLNVCYWGLDGEGCHTKLFCVWVEWSPYDTPRHTYPSHTTHCHAKHGESVYFSFLLLHIPCRIHTQNEHLNDLCIQNGTKWGKLLWAHFNKRENERGREGGSEWREGRGRERERDRQTWNLNYIFFSPLTSIPRNRY